MRRNLMLTVALLMTLIGLCLGSAYAWEDRDSYTQRDAMRQQEQEHADRLNREDRQRTEDYHRQLERDRQDRQRADEVRTYNRQDRDGSSQLCSSTRYSTVCN